MEVKIDSIVPTPSSLLLGAVIRGPRGSWFRFCTIELEWSAVSYTVIQRCLEFKERSERDEVIEDPLF